MKRSLLFFTMIMLSIEMSLSAQEIGAFADPRDGKTYKTVKIGTQTWMAENLAYKSGSGCWAYDDDTTNVKKYGYLYDWETAKKVCPVGWHLPTDAEWKTLIKFLGGDSAACIKMRIPHEWDELKGENSSGFSALPAGGRKSDGNYGYLREDGYWWTSTSSGETTAWTLNIYSYYNKVDLTDEAEVTAGASIRCVKD